MSKFTPSLKHGLHVLYAFIAAAVPVLIVSDSFRSFVENHGLSAGAFALVAAAVRAGFHAKTGK